MSTPALLLKISTKTPLVLRLRARQKMKLTLLSGSPLVLYVSSSQ